MTAQTVLGLTALYSLQGPQQIQKQSEQTKTHHTASCNPLLINTTQQKQTFYLETF